MFRPSHIHFFHSYKNWRQLQYRFSSTLHHPPPPKNTRIGRYTRRSLYIIGGVGGLWALDKEFNASAITRNLRTLWTCAAITLDYKWNFTAEKTEQIPELHERVANRLYNLLTGNGGLYIKIGQAIGANAAFLPKPIQIKFGRLFDDAPQIPFSHVKRVVERELRRPLTGPNGIFEVFEEQAVASASIAQVHKAKLWPQDGDEGERWVAVKVQKPDVAKQVNWDLGAYRAVMWMFENVAFDLPVYFVVDFVSDHMRQELDFEREAENARQTAQFVASEPRLAEKVYIPKVYPQYTTKKVLTAEWIEGVRLSDKSGILRLMGERAPPQDSSSPILDMTTGAAINIPQKPLKGGVKAIMQTMVELFSAQMFDWGWVHCDPHPGNIIIRPNPQKPTRPQLVLIDHGLYVRADEKFREQWVNLWKGMLAGDYNAVDRTTRQWGMGMPELLANATMMKPVKLHGGPRREKPLEEMTQYEQSVWMKKQLKGFLTDVDRMPKVLIFLTRNMRMVQGNNQSLGSPVNRVKITGFWASRSPTNKPNLSFTQRIREYLGYVNFRLIMFTLDLAFWRTRILQLIRAKLGLTSFGFEDELEKTMRGFAKANLGLEMPSEAFAG